jgi:excisionase family DNA binding protein
MDKIMTTKELAAYIKLNEKTVIKMAQEGKLPGIKLSNKWRFQLSAIDAYLQNQIVGESDEMLALLINTKENAIPLSRLTDEKSIALDLGADSIDTVLKELVSIAENAGGIASAQELVEQLRKREKMLSTAIGGGIALPHPRNPRVGLVSKPHFILGRSETGIDFDAPDKKKVHLFFLVCAPNAFSHIRLLARIAQFLHYPAAYERLMNANSYNDVLVLLLEFERQQLLLKETK